MGLPGQIVYPAGHDRPIASVARFVMEKIVETYATHGKSLPTYRLITIGSVAVDTELVAVMFGQVYTGTPGNEMNSPMRRETPRSCSMNIELWRNTPSLSDDGVDPGAAEQSVASEVIMDDAWLLLEAAYAADQMGVGVIANVTVMEPQGELHGLSMALEMQVF